MTFQPADRMPDRSDATTSVSPLSRSPAQRDASRINGARSRGPKTALGKRRASTNAMRHGLFAHAVMPVADQRRHHILFTRFRLELIEEFRPKSFTQHALLDVLAHEYVQLARATSIVESLMRPVNAPADLEQAERLHEQQRYLQGLVRVRDALAGGEAPCLPPKTATLVARRLITGWTQLAEDVAQGPPEPGADGKVDAFEKKEFDELVDRAGDIKRLPARLRDVHDLSRLLSGNAAVRTPILKHLIKPVKDAIDWVERWIRSQEPLKRRLIQQTELKLQSLAQEPVSLVLLQRYTTRIERSIERKIRLLRDRG